MQVGIPIRDPNGEIFRGRLAISLALFALLVLAEAAVRKRRNQWSTARSADDLRTRWPRERLVLALSGLVAYYVVYACYHNLKSWDVLNTPRDDLLLHVDAALFLGHSPAVLLHDVFGQKAAAYVMAVIYESFGYLVTLTVVATMAFAQRIREGYVFLASSLWVWILGVGSYYLIPSLGPFVAAPRDFAQLPHTVISTTQTKYLAQRNYLLHHLHASDAFAQISAFASLHVAFTCVILLMMHYYRFRRATIAMALYLAATIVATVYLGWHYVVDDIAGLVLAVLAVTLGRRMIDPNGRANAQQSHELLGGD
jgi:membrane-associated phospholipid phosphatase